VLAVGTGCGIYLAANGLPLNESGKENETSEDFPELSYRPRQYFDSSGNIPVSKSMEPWSQSASLQEIGQHWEDGFARMKRSLDAALHDPQLPTGVRVKELINLASWHHYAGHPERAYQTLEGARALAESTSDNAEAWLYTVIYYQGLTALRRGETENCVLCRGESSCILPLSPDAVYSKPEGSQQAIEHLTEYLEQFPDDLEVRWLLNVAHMTLGQYPDKVDPQYLIKLDAWTKSEFNLGRFRNVGAEVGINRLNQAGATIFDDFDNDGLYDILFTSYNPAPVVLYKNLGNGKFADVTEQAGLSDQLGELGAAAADFNNDGHLDFYLPRGSWQPHPIRPSLLRNNGDGTFSDVTQESGLLDPVNSDTVGWADFDNDGHVDLFVACERQPCRLWRNRGDGTFENVAAQAGLASDGGMWKGAAWLDFDNDRHIDLFLTSYQGSSARLFKNNGDGTFSDVTFQSGIDGPQDALSCWAWDYDNDGYLDLFAPSYKGTMETVLRGMVGPSLQWGKNRLYRNLGGKRFEDVSKEVGLDASYAAMGMNFGDFDNDGFLDFYLGTGDHDLATLVPNRLFKNVGGQRFADITAATGTGNLQKGHGVGCGDWDRNGTVDIVIQMGGPLPGDRYHNILFQNPGQGNNWLSVKLVGKQTNRSAIGARIKAVTAGDTPLTVQRVVSSGCSFGGNPLEQHLGLGKADQVATLEIYWPTSDTTQVFRDVPVNQAVEITEFASDYRQLDRRQIMLQK
jgi:hypothetical protein